MPPDTESESGIEAWANAMRSLAKASDRGALAELRRSGTELPAAFWKIAVKTDPHARPERIKRMALVFQLLALRPENLIAGRRKLGAALAAENISEARVQKLMTARGPALDDQVIRIARRLANGGSLPYRELSELLLAENHDSPAVESMRLEIARGYWVKRAAASPETTESED